MEETINKVQFQITIQKIQALIAIIGAAATLQEAVTWLEEKENAERLLAEGHESDAPDED